MRHASPFFKVAQGIRIFVGDSSGFVSMAKVGQMEVQLLRSPGGKVVFLETGPDFVESWLQHRGKCIFRPLLEMK